MRSKGLKINAVVDRPERPSGPQDPAFPGLSFKPVTVPYDVQVPTCHILLLDPLRPPRRYQVCDLRQLRTRCALFDKAGAIPCVMTTTGEGVHVMQGPDDRRFPWDLPEENLVVKETYNPVKVDNRFWERRDCIDCESSACRPAERFEVPGTRCSNPLSKPVDETTLKPCDESRVWSASELEIGWLVDISFGGEKSAVHPRFHQ